jgi:hypothetical protein
MQLNLGAWHSKNNSLETSSLNRKIPQEKMFELLPQRTLMKSRARCSKTPETGAKRFRMTPQLPSGLKSIRERRAGDGLTLPQ